MHSVDREARWGTRSGGVALHVPTPVSVLHRSPPELGYAPVDAEACRKVYSLERLRDLELRLTGDESIKLSPVIDPQ